jgi:hypothetical protein
MIHTLYQTRGPLDQTSVLFVSNRDMLADPPLLLSRLSTGPPLTPTGHAGRVIAPSLSAALTRDFAGQQWLELKPNKEKTLPARSPNAGIVLELCWQCPGSVLRSWQRLLLLGPAWNESNDAVVPHDRVGFVEHPGPAVLPNL